MTVIVDTATGVPAERLRPYVSRYTGYRYAGLPPGVHIGLPGPSLTMVISLADPTLVAADRSRQPVGHSALVGGMHTRPVFIPHEGEQYGVQLQLTPDGARSLLGLPAAALAGTVAGLDDLLGPAAARELPDRLAAASGWAGRFAVLDEVLWRCAGRLDPPEPVLAGIWGRVLDSGGTVRVADLAREFGWSRRYLTGRFTAEFGLGPKDLARVVRFERSRLLLRGSGWATIAEVASRCGYYDQAHLAREWRDLAGVAPTGWLAGDDLAAVS